MCDSPKHNLEYEIAPRSLSLFDEMSCRKSKKPSVVLVFGKGVIRRLLLHMSNYLAKPCNGGEILNLQLCANHLLHDCLEQKKKKKLIAILKRFKKSSGRQ